MSIESPCIPTRVDASTTVQNFERPSRAIIVIVFLIASSFLLWQFWRPSEEDETKEVSLAALLEEAGIEDAERIP